MIDHIGLRTRRFVEMSAFYEAVLAPLGYRKLFTYEGGAGFAREGATSLWIGDARHASAGIHEINTNGSYAARSVCGRVASEFLDFLFLPQPPSSRATDMQAARNSSARARSTIFRATTMPPMDKAAMVCAILRRRRPFRFKLRSKTLTIALKTVSKARFALMPLRATSVGSATIGQEFSTSSKCWRDR